MHRLFVAIELGAGVADACGRLADDLRARARALAPAAKITWVPPDRMHVTVRFIGSVDAARMAAIAGALRTPLDVAPFDLTVAGADTFPPHGRPKVIWAGVAGGLDGARRIERAVASRLDPIVGVDEGREYRPHVTLARVREAATLRARALVGDIDAASLGTTHVEGVTLFESRMSPKGSTYARILEVRLKPDPTT